MTTLKIFPKWTLNLGALHANKAYVRSQCDTCGIQHRVNVAEQILLHGPGATLIDRLDRCTIVGCRGTVFFTSASGIGRTAIPMVSDNGRIKNAAAPVNAAMLPSGKGKAVRR
ncbi:hypothetical protein [Novosphingobium terrae]|uniref:hypothetical protein n=1 Tax=Novosphingobium terrae TaxID=2726189 RepID=UPI00197E9755|nr:hypothetical protein [Novosphingobium terrae]